MQENMPVDSILTEDLTNVKTTIPLLPEGEYRLKVVKMDQTQNKAKTGNVIKVLLNTVEPCVDVNGKPVEIGSPIFHNMSITTTPALTKDSIVKRLKRFQEACGVSSANFHPLMQYEGRVLRAQVEIQAADGDYDESNRIKRFVVPKA